MSSINTREPYHFKRRKNRSSRDLQVLDSVRSPQRHADKENGPPQHGRVVQVGTINNGAHDSQHWYTH